MFRKCGLLACRGITDFFSSVGRLGPGPTAASQVTCPPAWLAVTSFLPSLCGSLTPCSFVGLSLHCPRSSLQFYSRASQPGEETTTNTVLLRLKVNRCSPRGTGRLNSADGVTEHGRCAAPCHHSPARTLLLSVSSPVVWTLQEPSDRGKRPQLRRREGMC